MTSKLKFFTYIQNNSGGSFDNDPEAGIGNIVIIEAIDADESNYRAKRIGLYFDGCASEIDCDCCGDRWYPVDDDDAKDIPSLYGKSVYDQYADYFNTDAYIHKYGQKFEYVKFKEKDNVE